MFSSETFNFLFKRIKNSYVTYYFKPREVGPCHHGMALPQVEDGGTASEMEGSCEYTKYAVADRLQWVVLQLGSWVRC